MSQSPNHQFVLRSLRQVDPHEGIEAARRRMFRGDDFRGFMRRPEPIRAHPQSVIGVLARRWANREFMGQARKRKEPFPWGGSTIPTVRKPRQFSTQASL